MTPEIRHLKALALDESRRKYPSLPEAARTVHPYNDKDANSLARCILDFLRLKGHQGERISVTGRYIDQSRIVTDVVGIQRKIGTGRWIRPSMQPGTSDLSAVIKGRAVKIEIKIGKDRQSPAQKRYQQQVEQAGGVYVIASSFAQFYNWYQSFIPDKRVKINQNEQADR